MRLFIMTLIAWIGARIARRTSPGVYWTAIVLAALLFGAGHLPLAFATWGVGAVNVARTLVLNGSAESCSAGSSGAEVSSTRCSRTSRRTWWCT